MASSVGTGVEKARQAKASLSPYSCGRCDVCKTRFANRLQLATEQRSLALVTPISFRHALDLERAGIGTVEDLVRADPRAISQAARVSEKRGGAWKKASSAAVMGSAVVLRRPEVLPDPANMVALDTEHGMFPRSHWLIGIRVVRHGESADHILWAWEDDAGYKALKRAAKLLQDHRDLPIVTWNGLADLERVAGAAEAWAAVGEKIRIDRADVARRHIDMLKVVRGSIALAIPSLRLKEVAQYLGVPADPVRIRLNHHPRAMISPVLGTDSEGLPELTIADGRDAQEAISFLRDWSKPSANDLAVRRAVEEYLRQDLRLTAEVTRHVVALLAT